MFIVGILLSSWGLSASLMLLMWLLFMITNNPAIVDLGWVLGITAIGAYAFMQLERTTWVHSIFLGLLLIWAVRLGGFLLFTRIIPGHLDSRYAVIKNSFSTYEALNFLINYQVQALLASFFAFALYATFHHKSYSTPVIITATVLILAGIIGQGIADHQLYSFKQSGASGICEVGLWRYSRHPNYFFELLIWMGFAMTGLRSYTLLYSFITPLSLWVIMSYITIPLTERVSLSKRPAYRDYIERTHKLLPIKYKQSE